MQIPKNKFRITKSPMEIIYKKYGTTMYFAGSDGIDDTKGIIDEDKPIKLVVLDELTEFFDDGEGEDELTNIEATFVRGNKGGFQMIYLYNPPKNPNAPINLWCKKMEKREDCIHIHTDYRDVPVDWLGPDLIASAEMMKKADPKMYRWVWLGEAIGVDELIYYMFPIGTDRSRIRTGDMTGFTLVATMVSRMRQPLKRLVWTLTGRNFRGLENIITVDGNLEDRRARLNMQEIWLSSWMNCMNSMKTGSFIFFWIHLQKVWRKR